MGRNAIDLVRFWSKVDKGGECWLWMATKNGDGYGRFRHNGNLVGAHRLSYEMCIGPIPDGKQVLHSCDVPNCVNPEHLFLGTHRDNMIDMHKKKRHKKIERLCHPNLPHHSNGLCKSCYQKKWHEDHPGKRRQYYLKHYRSIS